MITLKEFKEAVNSLRKINDQVNNIYTSYKIDLSEMDSITEGLNLFDLFISSYFTDKGWNLIFWWIYENVPKIIYESTIFGEEEINIEDINDLWSYLIGHKEEYFK